MKRTEALLARERRHELRVTDLEATVAALRQEVTELRQR